MIAVVLDLLRCPRCARGFLVDGRSVRCASGHVFDVAKQGYVNLTGAAQPAHADTAAMVAARDALLGSGRYLPLSEALVDLAPTDLGTVVDVGTGTGHYAAALLDARSGARGLGLDVSVAACRRAARAHPRLGVVTADAWRGLPVADGSADLVLSVFSPRNADEFVRVLRPGGSVITATPTAEHLVELRSALGLLGIEGDKETRLADAFARAGLRPLQHRVVVASEQWQREDVERSIMMGPNAFHTVVEEVAAATQQWAWPRAVTISCQLIRWGR